MDFSKKSRSPYRDDLRFFWMQKKTPSRIANTTTATAVKVPATIALFDQNPAAEAALRV
jgi:hypothetical protein